MRLVERGKGKKIAVVFSPMQAYWGEDSNFLGLLELLLREFKLIYVDSLQWLGKESNMQEYASKAANDVMSCCQNAQLIIGCAFGGTLLQYLLAGMDTRAKRVILFSSPSYVDSLLKKRLIIVRDFLALGKDEKAIAVFEKYVGQKVFGDSQLSFSGKSRLIRAINLLLTADARSEIVNIEHEYIHFLGEESLLANKNNIVVADEKWGFIVPGAGMRVLEENFQFCQKVVKAYLGV